jgi:hypothetical protein
MRMHHFNHTINNRLKFLYFIRLLLPPRSRINKCQIATNFNNTNRPPCKLLIGLHVREDINRTCMHTLRTTYMSCTWHTIYIITWDMYIHVSCNNTYRPSIFCTDVRDNRTTWRYKSYVHVHDIQYTLLHTTQRPRIFCTYFRDNRDLSCREVFCTKISSFRSIESHKVSTVYIYMYIVICVHMCTTYYMYVL